MLAVIGTALLVLSGALCGRQFGIVYLKRLEMHKKLLMLYEHSAILFEYSMLTLEELVQRLSCIGELSQLDFLYIPDNLVDTRSYIISVIKTKNRTGSDESERNLLDFFTAFGTSDIKGQCAYARLAAERERRELIRVEESYKKRYCVLCKLGALAGAFAAVMMN
ncbi:MAG: hypothetical protein IKH90_06295 [Ruminococcus sp.]|nr:hypothetical protein [Ruminococcus sp.]